MKNINDKRMLSLLDGKWCVPQEIINKLGRFDIDPCSPVDRPWNTANEHISIMDDGLTKEWKGRVFCNPPSGEEYEWVEKCANHGNAIAMLFSKSDTKCFHDIILRYATAILWIKGRVKFHYSNGKRADSAMLASMIVAFNHENAKVLEKSGIVGSFLWLKYFSDQDKKLEGIQAQH